MKLQVTLREKDAVYNATQRTMMPPDTARSVEIELGRWFRFGEYLVVEFDTIEGTATVIEKEP